MLRCTRTLVPYQKYKRQFNQLKYVDLWCIYWEADKKNEGLPHTRAAGRAGPWPWPWYIGPWSEYYYHCYCPLASLCTCIYTEEVRLLLVTREHTYKHSQTRRLPKSSSAERHLHGCASDHAFGERTRDCSLRPLDQH
jgi:hypothetical protein